MPKAPEISLILLSLERCLGCDSSFPVVSYPSLLSQETPTNELSVQGTPEGDTDPSTPPAPPTPPHPATPGDGFPNNDSGFGEGRSPRLRQRKGGVWEGRDRPYYAVGVSCRELGAGKGPGRVPESIQP